MTTKAVLLVPFLLVSACVESATSAADEGSQFALLVGVQEYAHLGPDEQLDGCRNDVEAMRSLLVERFGLAEDNVGTLVDADATGEAIRKELNKLVERVRRLPSDALPADVVFHFSGHGSQLPDQYTGDDRDEEDGFDETLVPFDAQEQGGDQDIRDDELYQFAQNLCGDGRARLWVVLDSCHSGTGVRGATKIRNHPRPNLKPTDSDAPIVKKKLPESAIVLSACRAAEQEPEFPADGKRFGLLTRFLVQVLHETRSVSDLSYEALLQAIASRYRTSPDLVQAPTPQLEGASRALQQTVLGAGSEADRPPYWRVIPAGRSRSTAVLKAGSFHGVTAGSLYELYERPEDIVWDPHDADTQEAAIGWLRIESVDGTTANASVFEWNADRTEQFEIVLPRAFEEGYAVERYHHPGEHAIRVRVVRAQNAETDSPPLRPNDQNVPEPVQKALLSAENPGEIDWVRWVEDDTATCDLLLRIDPPFAALFPAAGMSEIIQREEEQRTPSGGVPKSLIGGWGPIDLRRGGEAEPQLKEYLRQITRARNLIRLAESQHTRGRTDMRVGLGLVSVELDEDYRVLDWHPRDSTRGRSPQTRVEDIYAVRVSNPSTSDHPVYVTVLGVNANMEIDVIVPYNPGDDDAQHIAPGEDKITDAFRAIPPTGPRWTIALATREPNNLFLLAQPALPKVKGTRGASGLGSRGAGPDTLEELLLQQTYFQTRGDARLRPQKLDDDSWSAALLPWSVELPR